MPEINNINGASRIKFKRRKSFELYKKVITLRKKEFSYTEIRQEIGLAKSTINNWLSYADLTLSKKHLQIQSKNTVRNHIIGTAASKKTRAKRKEDKIQLFIQNAKKYFPDQFFCSRYEAEESKGNHNGFSNSDFRMIVICVCFLEKYFFS